MNAQTPRWFIQEHDGGSRHYDLRVEIGGRLRCWMLPEGPSADPAQRRLAVEADDHGIATEDFEGRIDAPGAGAVLLWDKGHYWSIHEGPVEACYAEGRLELWLKGFKLKGGYEIVREQGDRWRFVKVSDETADPGRDPVVEEPGSVKTGRTIEEIEAS